MKHSIWIGLLCNMALMHSVLALTCQGTLCGSMHDSCCLRNTHNNKLPKTSHCCKSVPNEWVVKTSGIGIGLTVIVLFIVIFCSCKQKIRRLTGIRQLPNDPDLPPSYETLKKVSEPEPPSYFKLFPIPLTSEVTRSNELQRPDASSHVRTQEFPVTSRENDDVASTSTPIKTNGKDAPNPHGTNVTLPPDDSTTSASNEIGVATSHDVHINEAKGEGLEKCGHDNLALTLEPI